MWDPTLWGIIGGAVGLLASVVVSAIGYFIKRTLTGFDTRQEKLERSLLPQMLEVRNEMDEVEKASLRTEKELHKEINKLSDKYVPRDEIREIVHGIRDSAATNAQSNAVLAEKIDKVLMILARGGPPTD